MEELVKLENVTKVYRVGEQDVSALGGVSLSVRPGEYVAIMGASGSGKSTLLNLLGCLDRPTAGQYWLGGEDVSQMTDRQLSHARNRRIGFVFQSFNLIAPLNVLANIEVPLFYQGMPRRQRHQRSRELAELVGLKMRFAHRSSELSGGQQQRVAIARALANDPLILLADEPTGNLDSHTSDEILALLDDLHGRGRAIVMVTHEEDVAARAQRVIRLKDGLVEWDRPQPHVPRGESVPRGMGVPPMSGGSVSPSQSSKTDNPADRNVRGQDGPATHGPEAHATGGLV